MAPPNKKAAIADSGGEDPIIVKDSGGEDPIIVKDSGGEDPIIVKGGGPGDEASVNVLLNTPARMGWTIAIAGDVTTVMIPKTAPWQIETDRITGKVYLERPNAIITKMLVDDMVDMANPTVDVPPVQAPKPGNDPEIEIYFSPI